MPDPDAAWLPARLELAVGDWVRVRLSGECRHVLHGSCDDLHGATGMVVRVEDVSDEAVEAREWGEQPGHRYGVRFDSQRVDIAWFARAELERLADGGA